MDVKKILSQMTLEEKCSYLSGWAFWNTKVIDRLNVPTCFVTDGPHGVRKQPGDENHQSIGDPVKSVCFPSGCCSACSFNRELIHEMGKCIGEECQDQDVQLLLGPGVNIKRSPLCGRCFEYYSEDPYLTAQAAISHVSGVQSQNVGATLKHFYAHSQETNRMQYSSDIDERTLNEIYWPVYKDVIEAAHPWSIMASYNRVNGVRSSENPELTTLLRDKWGFDGFVISDWGGVTDRVLNTRAGLDLEMPASHGINDREVLLAVQRGELDESYVDKCVEHILTFVKKGNEGKKPGFKADYEAHHKVAIKLAQDSIVLLKNNDNLLPLKKDDKKVAFIGLFAEKPRYQGGGSSHINPIKIVSPKEAAEKAGLTFKYAQGYTLEGEDKAEDEKLLNEAVAAAKDASVAVVFAGLPESFESEGYDRTHLNMSDNQNKLISAVAAVNKNTVVVLMNGAAILMPWLNEVKSVLECYLCGQGIGEASVSILYGEVSPSGRLAETFPLRLQDTPAYINWPGNCEDYRIPYAEGVFVGYRWYSKRDLDVLFPFGYGLSYSKFEYSNIRVNKENITDSENVEVTVHVKNVGSVQAKEVVQLYIAAPSTTVPRPVRELRNFQKVDLKPGEGKDVTFTVTKRDFAYWSVVIHDWRVETGDFKVQICENANKVLLEKTIHIKSSQEHLPIHLTMDTLAADAMRIPVIKDEILKAGQLFAQAVSCGETMSDAMIAALVKGNPLRTLVTFTNGKLSYEWMREIIRKGDEWLDKNQKQ